MKQRGLALLLGVLWTCSLLGADLREDTATQVAIGPFLDGGDGVTAETALTVTDWDCDLIKHANSGMTNTALTITASGGSNDAAHMTSGMYSLEFTATDTNTAGRLVLICDHATPTTFMPVRHEWEVKDTQTWDSDHGADTRKVEVIEWNGVTLATTNPLPNAAPDTAGGLPISDAGGLDLDAQFAKLGTMPNLGGGANLGQAIRDLAGATFATSTDSNEALRNRGDSAWITATGFSTHSAADVWAVATRVLTAATNLGFPTNFGSMDINATGGVGVDWGNVQNPTTTVGLTNTTIAGFTTAGLTATVNAVLLGQGIPAPTTIATLASQTSFTLTAGSADDNAYNGYGIIVRDASTAAQQALGCVRDYTGSTRTVTLLEDPAIFTMATSDNVSLLPAYCDAQVVADLLETAMLICTVDTANFAGDANDFACDLTDRAGAAVTSNLADNDLAGLEVVVITGAQQYEKRFVSATTDWDGANNEMRLNVSRDFPATLADGVTVIIR